MIDCLRNLHPLLLVHLSCPLKGRCKVARKQDVLDMSKTTKLPNIATVTRNSSRKFHTLGIPTVLEVSVQISIKELNSAYHFRYVPASGYFCYLHWK